MDTIFRACEGASSSMASRRLVLALLQLRRKLQNLARRAHAALELGRTDMPNKLHVTPFSLVLWGALAV